MPTTLLLADDSVVIQKLVGLSFVNEDIEIVSVDNGDDAVTRAVECKPDVILADVVMPGKSGYEVCAAVRSNPDLANTPVLLLTGTFEAFDEARASEVGATGHITKPFEAQALVDRVTEILAERTPAEAAPEAPAAETGFFGDDLSEAGNSEMPAETTADTIFDQGEVLTPPPLAPESTDEVSARSIPIEPASGLDDLLDGAGGDNTIAIMPDAPLEAAPAVPSEPAPNLDQTMIVDDFLNDASPSEPMPEPAAMDAADVETDSPTKSAIGALNLQAAAAPDPLSEFAGSPPRIEAPIAPPTAPERSNEFADLGLGSETDIPVDQLETPNPDATLLADDMFGGDGEFPDIPDLEDNFDAGLTDSLDTDFAASDGLDIDFGAPASDAMVPESTSAYDVSTSDLGDSALGDSQSWGSGVPAGVETAPEPIAIPHDVIAPPEPPAETSSNDSSLDATLDAAAASDMSEEPIELMDEPTIAPPAETSPADVTTNPEISFAPPVPETSATDEPAGDTQPAATGTPSDTDARPDLTPVMRDRIHDTLEKVAWEAFADLSDDIVRQLMQRVEQIAWEVIPQMAETLIQDEIRRMKGEEGEE